MVCCGDQTCDGAGADCLLVADVFASGDNLNDVAARWLHQFDDNNSHELAELINFVLRCAGCDSKVEEHDMEDPDNCDSKLNDIQEEYQAVSDTGRVGQDWILTAH